MKKPDVLSGRGAFDGVFRSGRRFEGDLLGCHVSTLGAHRGVRVGFAVSSRAYGAVQRNRLRRLMREAFRRERAGVLAAASESSRSVSIVFRVRPRTVADAGRLSLQAVHTDVALLCRRVCAHLAGIQS